MQHPTVQELDQALSRPMGNDNSTDPEPAQPEDVVVPPVAASTAPAEPMAELEPPNVEAPEDEVSSLQKVVEEHVALMKMPL